MLKFSDRQMRLINYYLYKYHNDIPILHDNSVREVKRQLKKIKSEFDKIMFIDEYINFSSFTDTPDKFFDVKIYPGLAKIEITRRIKIDDNWNNDIEINSIICNRSNSLKILNRQTWKYITRKDIINIMAPIGLAKKVNEIINE